MLVYYEGINSMVDYIYRPHVQIATIKAVCISNTIHEIPIIQTMLDVLFIISLAKLPR